VVNQRTRGTRVDGLWQRPTNTVRVLAPGARWPLPPRATATPPALRVRRESHGCTPGCTHAPLMSLIESGRAWAAPHLRDHISEHCARAAARRRARLRHTHMRTEPCQRVKRVRQTLKPSVRQTQTGQRRLAARAAESADGRVAATCAHTRAARRRHCSHRWHAARATCSRVFHAARPSPACGARPAPTRVPCPRPASTGRRV